MGSSYTKMLLLAWIRSQYLPIVCETVPRRCHPVSRSMRMQSWILSNPRFGDLRDLQTLMYHLYNSNYVYYLLIRPGSCWRNLRWKPHYLSSATTILYYIRHKMLHLRRTQLFDLHSLQYELLLCLRLRIQTNCYRPVHP